MNWTIDPPLSSVHRRAEFQDASIDDRRLRAAVGCGEAVRIAPGSYANRIEWEALSPIARHAQRVWEAAARTADGRMFSHHAAAALWGLDILGDWPQSVDVSGNGIGGSSGAFRRHELGVRTPAAVPWNRHQLTTPAQTAIDLAADLPFTEGVVVADQALWSRRPVRPLATAEQLRDAAERYRGRAHARVRRVSEFARAGADSVRESQSRVLIARLGFPEPELQHRFVLPSGRVAYSDFWWPEFSQIGEFDGLGKYFHPDLRHGRTPEHALIHEKDRADELRRQVRVISRWRTPALARPRLLYDILTGDGLPSNRPRPGH